MDKKIIALRHELHDLAEPSGGEFRTKEKLKAFLRENTTLELTDCKGGFYAAHREAVRTRSPSRAEDMLISADTTDILRRFAAQRLSLSQRPSDGIYSCCFNRLRRPERELKAALSS